MDVALTPVDSSQIHAVGFNPETNTLAVQFKNKSGPSSVYHYANFSQAQYNAFVESDSLGKYFGQNIKGNPDFPFTKIEPEKQTQDSGDA